MPRGRRYRGRRITGAEFAAVIRDFLASEKFKGLARSTQVNYRHNLEMAAHFDTLGSVPVEELRPALVQAFLDGYADRPAQQKCAQTAIKSLEKWALVRDKLAHPITLGTEAPGGTGGHVPWTDEHVALAERHAAPHLARVITLAANTGQRGSDLVRMRWSDVEEYEGRPGINVTQIKTGLTIWIPLTQELMGAMRGWERRPGYFLLKEDGKPFSRPQLSDQWLRERDTNAALAPLATAGLSMHGLRATAVVRLRRAGAGVLQIADMVGMSPPMVSRYCRFSVQRENALAAVVYLDRTPREQARAKSSFKPK
jgi:integrase